MTKGQLKKIVKECLLEILSEGLGNATSSMTETRNIVPRKQSNHPVLDRPAIQATQQNAMKNLVKQVAGGDNIMESILADTANNTLPQMLSAERGMPTLESMGSTGPVQQEQFEGNPEEIFGNAMQWANLAFTQTKKLA
jgi:hypothetical protein